jgi:hypothetical protein
MTGESKGIGKLNVKMPAAVASLDITSHSGVSHPALFCSPPVRRRVASRVPSGVGRAPIDQAGEFRVGRLCD